jgi:hypothetical protein
MPPSQARFSYFSPNPLYITHPKLFIRDTAVDKDIHPTDVWIDKVEAIARQRRSRKMRLKVGELRECIWEIHSGKACHERKSALFSAPVLVI